MALGTIRLETIGFLVNHILLIESLKTRLGKLSDWINSSETLRASIQKNPSSPQIIHLLYILENLGTLNEILRIIDSIYYDTPNGNMLAY
ncbi:MAG: hypothetical protein AB8Y25_02320 [Coxiella endosymbiont of Haemaphysalis qinghaiensis]